MNHQGDERQASANKLA